MADVKRVLVANRGEIALRIIRAAKECGFVAVAIYSQDDAKSLHVSRADEAILLEGNGPSAYLNAEQIVQAAVDSDCFAIHPGYGFLSEQASFLDLVERSSLLFIGPTQEQLALLGDKEKACSFARKQGLPTLLSSGVLTNSSDLLAFCENGVADLPVILKAVSGGGGRGLRIVQSKHDSDLLFEQASAE
ncbi:MAG: hypothetical protein CMO23_06495, partial [Thiotrichales bacterium]|nr:hypothetical protein [Thiotrichales bacterium]